MSKPVVLDLFCGAGGAAMGYHRAGFRVIGVDNQPQPHFPFEFHQLEWVDGYMRFGQSVSVIHASPPCKAYTRMINPVLGRHVHPDMVPVVREVLYASNKEWVLENVPSAPMHHRTRLCGQSFGLRVIRERYFESSINLLSPVHQPHTDFVPFTGYREREWRDAAGLHWMTTKEARQAIPPIYTEYLGLQLLISMECM